MLSKSSFLHKGLWLLKKSCESNSKSDSHDFLPLIRMASSPINPNLLFVNIEKSGKTLHLLKSNSKPIRPRTKRKKIELLGTLGQYNDSKKKPVPPPSDFQPNPQQQR